MLCSSAMATVIGIVMYAYFNEWIIFRNPWHVQYDVIPDGTSPRQHRCNLFFWQHQRWQREQIMVTAPACAQERMMALMQAWGHEAYERNMLHKPCIVQSVILDARSGCAYISFAATPFDENESTHVQLIILESLLKTIHCNEIPEIKSVRFLINHAPWESAYIDGHTTFPITGLGIIN